MMNLDSLGVSGVFVASSEFRDAARHQAHALGVADVSVLVPHPIQDRSDPEMVALAEAALEAIVSRLLDGDGATTEG
jgi:hypothetical protein